MSEIGRDATHLVDRGGEIAQQFGAGVDHAYAAAKGFDWGAVSTLIVALFAIAAAVGVVRMCIGANRTPAAKPEPPHPTPGDPGYLDWANRTGAHASPDTTTQSSTPEGPFRW